MTHPKNTGHSFRFLERQHRHLAEKITQAMNECYTADAMELEIFLQLKKYVSNLEHAADSLEEEYKNND